jgi:hypothetical protein
MPRPWVPPRLGLRSQRSRRRAAADRDYLAAAASHHGALQLFRGLGNLLGQAEALNRLGELATRTSATGPAGTCHTQALAIARDLGAAPEEARRLEGIGHSYLRVGNPAQAAAPLRDALAIYQRIGSPAAQRVEEALRQHGLCPASAHPAPTGQRPVNTGRHRTSATGRSSYIMPRSGAV